MKNIPLEADAEIVKRVRRWLNKGKEHPIDTIDILRICHLAELHLRQSQQTVMNLKLPQPKADEMLSIHHIRVNDCVWDSPDSMSEIVVPPDSSLVIDIKASGVITVHR